MLCVFSARAEDDLEAIGDYIAQDNPVRALSFVQEIRERCENMAHYPLAAPLVPEYGEGVRRVPFGRYAIFYTVSDDAVTIEHIRHGARRSERL